ncbi:hypothetical protein SY27_00325 [Flavobacterium sp. 316]|uniref:hypothetical protein n=1 Tax=Flavobacterium sp. 316 TaxID=1603293 RepID=UPI0005E981C6|nr:hypothetical protein [Flavobacterium sp. 316]KIX22343.1 hypothetical protein SY27_00325 [Flavobacterium sp. 316]
MKYCKHLFFLVFLFLLSCDKDIVYSKFYSDFKENRWLTKEVKSFDFLIKNNESKVDLILHLGHVYDFQFQSVPFNVIIFYPDGKKESIPINLKIKDENGKDLADCSGDICDLYFTIKEKMALQKGKYKVEIKNNFSGDYLPNVLGVGIKVKKQ